MSIDDLRELEMNYHVKNIYLKEKKMGIRQIHDV